jgi:ABC-type phosphate/phosphonate transport system permease subunit
MKTLSKEVAAGVAFTAIGVAVALAVVFVQAAEATPDPGVSPGRLLCIARRVAPRWATVFTL